MNNRSTDANISIPFLSKGIRFFSDMHSLHTQSATFLNKASQLPHPYLVTSINHVLSPHSHKISPPTSTETAVMKMSPCSSK